MAMSAEGGFATSEGGFAPLPTLRGPAARSAASPLDRIARAKPALERRAIQLL